MSPKWQTPPPNLLALHSNNMHIYVGVKVRKPTCVVAIFTASLHYAEVVMENGIWFSRPFWAKASLSLANFWEVTCSIFWWLYFDNLGWCLGDYRVTQFASTCFIRQQLAGIKWNENTRFGRESLSCCCIYWWCMYSGIYKERYIGFGGRILNNDEDCGHTLMSSSCP